MKKSEDGPISPTAFKAPSRGTDKSDAPTTISRNTVVVGGAVFGVLLLMALLLAIKTIVISPSPNPVTYEVNEGLGFAIGNRIVGLSSSYALTAKAAGYHDLDFEASTADGDGGALSIALKKLPGLIHFDISPADDAVISIDGKQQATPADGILEVEVGSHEISVSHPRYLTFKDVLDVEGMGLKQTMPIVMERAWANIALSSEPQGAEVRHNGSVIGTTPFTAELLPDVYVLTYQRTGFENQKQLIETQTQADEVMAPVVLKPARASVDVSSMPSGARLFLNGAYLGVTPKSVAVEPATTHTFTAEMSGYTSAKQSLRLNMGGRKNITLKLEQSLGHVVFKSTPVTDVWLGHKKLGTTPLEVNLHAVEHKVEFKKDGYHAATHTFSPDPLREQVINVVLMTESEARHKEAKPTYRTSKGHTMVRLNPGRFMMGAPRGEPGQRSNEALRDVELTRLYYISQHEVTKSQFRGFAKSAATGNEPITNISWKDAALYCNWLSQKEGFKPFYIVQRGAIIGVDMKARGYRLPTEAEWAWAARVGTEGQPTRRFPWGDGNQMPKNAGNYGAKLTPSDGYAKLAPVGQFASSAAGLYDMGGNVAEWVHNYHHFPLPSPSQLYVDPMGPSNGLDYVIKGASWKTDTIAKARLSYRDYDHKARDDVGFRIARWID